MINQIYEIIPKKLDNWIFSKSAIGRIDYTCETANGIYTISHNPYAINNVYWDLYFEPAEDTAYPEGEYIGKYYNNDNEAKIDAQYHYDKAFAQTKRLVIEG